MLLMRIVFPKGRSQTPSIQCNALQQQAGLGILHSRYAHIQGLSGKKKKQQSLFHVLQQDTLGYTEFIPFGYE